MLSGFIENPELKKVKRELDRTWFIRLDNKILYKSKGSKSCPKRLRPQKFLMVRGFV